jgi:hypothetical protein
METETEIAEFDMRLRVRSAAYAEEAAAREASENAERNLRTAARDVAFDAGFDPVISVSLRGREAISRKLPAI